MLIRQPSDEDIATAMDRSLRIHALGEPHRAYWLRAALAVLPAADLQRDGESPADRGRRLERAVLRFMGLAITEATRTLRRERIETEEEVEAVIRAMIAALAKPPA